MAVNFHNHLVRGSRRAVFAAIGLGMVTSASAEITGKNTAEFETVISVQSTSDVCKLMVTPPADNTFAVSYSYKADGTNNMRLTSPNKDPRYIMVKAVGGASCDVGQVTMKVETSVGTRFVQSPPNSSGGIWTLRPEYTDARLYTNPNATSSMASETEVAVASKKSTSYMKPNAFSIAGGISSGYQVFGSNTLILTDAYIPGDATYPGEVNKLSIKDNSRAYKVLALGIGGYLGLVPNNAEGKPSPGLVSDGDVTSIPFTVTIGTQ